MINTTVMLYQLTDGLLITQDAEHNGNSDITFSQKILNDYIYAIDIEPEPSNQTNKFIIKVTLSDIDYKLKADIITVLGSDLYKANICYNHSHITQDTTIKWYR